MVKGGRCIGLTTLPPSCADWLEIWEPQSPGTLRGLSRPVTVLLALPRTVVYMQYNMTMCTAYVGTFNILVASYDIFPDLTVSIRKVSQNTRNRIWNSQEILRLQSTPKVQRGVNSSWPVNLHYWILIFWGISMNYLYVMDKQFDISWS
jgi:hypothetical protein